MGRSDMPNGFYLRNVEPDSVTVALSADVTISLVPVQTDAGPVDRVRDLAAFAALWDEDAPSDLRHLRHAPYHFHYLNGDVVAIVEQYGP